MEPKDRLKPVHEFRIYRRKYPHWELPGSVYFITFNSENKFPFSDDTKDIILETFHFHDGKKYILHAGVVMDTHSHCILQPLEETKGVFYSLANIMHSIKSFSANRIQRHLNEKGTVWQHKNYDRIIRDEKEYYQEMDYIANNPAKAGLVKRSEDYRWLYINHKHGGL